MSKLFNGKVSYHENGQKSRIYAALADVSRGTFGQKTVRISYRGAMRYCAFLCFFYRISLTRRGKQPKKARKIESPRPLRAGFFASGGLSHERASRPENLPPRCWRRPGRRGGLSHRRTDRGAGPGDRLDRSRGRDAAGGDRGGEVTEAGRFLAGSLMVRMMRDRPDLIFRHMCRTLRIPAALAYRQGRLGEGARNRWRQGRLQRLEVRQ